MARHAEAARGAATLAGRAPRPQGAEGVVIDNGSGSRGRACRPSSSRACVQIGLGQRGDARADGLAAGFRHRRHADSLKGTPAWHPQDRLAARWPGWRAMCSLPAGAATWWWRSSATERERSAPGARRAGAMGGGTPASRRRVRNSRRSANDSAATVTDWVGYVAATLTTPVLRAAGWHLPDARRRRHLAGHVQRLHARCAAVAGLRRAAGRVAGDHRQRDRWRWPPASS